MPDLRQADRRIGLLVEVDCYRGPARDLEGPRARHWPPSANLLAEEEQQKVVVPGTGDWPCPATGTRKRQRIFALAQRELRQADQRVGFRASVADRADQSQALFETTLGFVVLTQGRAMTSRDCRASWPLTVCYLAPGLSANCCWSISRLVSIRSPCARSS